MVKYEISYDIRPGALNPDRTIRDNDYSFLKHLKERGHEIRPYDPSRPSDLTFWLNLDRPSSERPGYNGLFINSPQGVSRTSPKTYELENFRHYLPETHKVRDIYENSPILSRGAIVTKPIHGSKGRGVELTEGNKYTLLSKIRSLSDDYLVQEVIPNQGDLRVLTYNGEIFGRPISRFNQNQFVNNVSAGGSWEYLARDLSSREKLMVQDISSRLLDEGVYFAGIDLIEGRLCEINTKAPGFYHEITSSFPEQINFFMEQTEEIIKRNL